MDWKFWLQRRRVKLWQAVALTLGVEPDDLKRRPGLTDGRTPQFDTTRLPNIEKQRAFARALTLAVDAVDYAAGPIWPEGPTFGKDKRLCDVKLADVAVYAVACEWWSDIPDEIRRLAQAPPVVPLTPQDSPVEAASAPKGMEPAKPNWKMLIQTEATASCLRLRKTGASPTKQVISESMARWCRENNVMTDSKIFPSANYLRTHVLGGSHWDLPN